MTKYAVEIVTESIYHGGQVMAKRQLLQDALSWNKAKWQKQRPTEGEIVAYRAELRHALRMYQSMVPEPVREQLRKKGIIVPEELEKMVSDEAFAEQLPSS